MRIPSPGESKLFSKWSARAALVAAGAMFTTSVFAANITGAGATFPYPIYAKWADAYKKATPCQYLTP